MFFCKTVYGRNPDCFQHILLQSQTINSEVAKLYIYYETLKSNGDYPIIGVNTFLNPDESYVEQCGIELARGTEEEKRSQLTRLAEFKERNKNMSAQAMERLHKVAQSDAKVFEELMETVKYCSLGQITRTLHVTGGGQY
ncbi:MAG: methylmalonyl-CoA mutase family protein [Desulfomonilaceae bacterium]